MFLAIGTNNGDVLSSTSMCPCSLILAYKSEAMKINYIAAQAYWIKIDISNSETERDRK
jgi:hypothetical protein